ncbi:MAG: hypothetical protein QG597_4743, partial [Actinomycetota bacterium]|nr:hypothetical protein [Actinomycetota bacterium]
TRRAAAARAAATRKAAAARARAAAVKRAAAQRAAAARKASRKSSAAKRFLKGTADGFALDAVKGIGQAITAGKAAARNPGKAIRAAASAQIHKLSTLQGWNDTVTNLIPAGRMATAFADSLITRYKGGDTAGAAGYALGTAAGFIGPGRVKGALRAAETVPTVGKELVPYSSEFASRNLLNQLGEGYGRTPGGRTLSAHAADRVVNGAPGRAPTTLERVDEVLDNPTKLRYDPARDAVRVSQKRAFVVASGTGPGQHVVTVMIP